MWHKDTELHEKLGISQFTIEKINDDDSEIVREHKFINNAVKRDNGQRNYVMKGLDNAEDNDLILLSDLDEIPSLNRIDLKNIKAKIIIFDQIMCYYKFNTDEKVKLIRFDGSKLYDPIDKSRSIFINCVAYKTHSYNEYVPKTLIDCYNSFKRGRYRKRMMKYIDEHRLD